jgi:hyaluronoglucosaminidase
MGEQLHPQIDLMWTGREICSGYLDISDAVIFDRSTRRPPFYWDNYPVNDGSMANRLHIGPIEGRESGLHRYSAGLLANPMDLFEASLLPIGIIGDYLWSTTTYDAWASWDSTLADLVPVESDRSAIREFFRNTLGMTGAWSPAFNVIIGECATAWRGGAPAEAAAAARAGAAKIRAAHATISHADFCAPLLRGEITPWLEKYELGASWLERMAAVLDSCSVAEGGQLTASGAAREELRDIRENLNTNSRRLFGDGFDIMLGELAAEIRYKD